MESGPALISGVGVVTISGGSCRLLVDSHGWRSLFWFLFVLQLVGGLPILAIAPRAQPRPHRLARRRADRRGYTMAFVVAAAFPLVAVVSAFAVPLRRAGG